MLIFPLNEVHQSRHSVENHSHKYNEIALRTFEILVQHRKIVSVVYDDSGSMDGDKWAYANYAMQSFCGMLNSDDQLFITYMSHSQQI